MPDTITLTGLTVRGHHGVYDFERSTGQEFVVDAVLELDLDRAAASDQVEDTVDYGELAERLAAIVGGEPVNLIEALAVRLLDACLDDRRVVAATVTVHKPQAPIRQAFADVAVTLRRQRPLGVGRPGDGAGSSGDGRSGPAADSQRSQGGRGGPAVGGRS